MAFTRILINYKSFVFDSGNCEVKNTQKQERECFSVCTIIKNCHHQFLMMVQMPKCLLPLSKFSSLRSRFPESKIKSSPIKLLTEFTGPTMDAAALWLAITHRQLDKISYKQLHRLVPHSLAACMHVSVAMAIKQSSIVALYSLCRCRSTLIRSAMKLSSHAALQMLAARSR